MGHRKKALAEGAEDLIHDDRKLICGIVYPGTELTIGSTTLRVTHETHSCRAGLFNGEIHLQ